MQGLVGRVEEPHPGSDDEGLGCHVGGGGDGSAAPGEDPGVSFSQTGPLSLVQVRRDFALIG